MDEKTEQKLATNTAKAYHLLISDLKQSYFELQKSTNPLVHGIGGLMILITSQTWRIADSVIKESMRRKNPSSERDIKEIKAEICRFLDTLIKEQEK